MPGGYSYCDDEVAAFSHLHLVGAGVTDLGNIGVIPVLNFTAARAQCFQPTVDGNDLRFCLFKQPFSHETELAEPGGYNVVLNDPESPGKANITVNLTATQHAAFHRYSYSAGFGSPCVVLDLCHSNNLGKGNCPNASVQVLPQPDGSVVVQGQQYNMGDFSKRFGGNNIWFYGRLTGGGGFDANQSGIWLANGTLLAGQMAARFVDGKGPQLGAYLVFRDASQPVELSMGVSFIDLAGAQSNLNMEIPEGSAFEDVQALARKVWSNALSVVTARFNASSLSEQQQQMQTKFYTALYHFYLAPTNWTEADGRYLGFDKAVHAWPGYSVYTDLSIWDTFRTEFPLLVLLRPEVARDVVQSLILMNAQLAQGFPKWAFCNGDTGSMEGLFVTAMLTDALTSATVDTTGINATQVLLDLAQRLRQREGDQWLQLGYFDSASESLCYAVNDFCVSKLASSAAVTPTAATQLIAAQFANTSSNWKLLFDPIVRFLCSKDPSTNDWVECQKALFLPVYSKNPFDQRAYTEGDAWQYRWFVPQAMPDLISKLGGNAKFVGELQHFFQASTYTLSNFMPNAFFWAGNEPDLQTPYLFNYADPPRLDLTSYWVRWTMQTHYTTHASGISGNDDYGTMSSWFVWSALGLYPDNCHSRYFVGIPLFDSAIVRLSAGADLTVLAHNNQVSNPSITVVNVTFNSIPITLGFIDATRIQSGGVLEFFLQ